MSAKSSTGLAAPSVQKWVIKNDVEYLLRSDTLHNRLQYASLYYGSIELYLRCHNLTDIGLGNYPPFCVCPSLLRVDLSGLPKLESIPGNAFGACTHLVSVVFGEHSNITNLGMGAFDKCYALTIFTLPDKLKNIEPKAFAACTSLERVVFN